MKQNWKFIFIAGLSLSGCYPATSRTNARLESGFDGSIKAGGNIALGKEAGSTTGSLEANVALDAELDLQFGHKTESNFGFAGQIKVIGYIYASTLDAYLELPSPSPLFYGIGFEIPISILTSIKSDYKYSYMPYGVVTIFLNKELYLTLTSRPILSSSKSLGNFSMSNQLTFGEAKLKKSNHDEFGETSGSQDLFIYFAYTYLSGDGIDVNPCFENCNPDLRNQILQIGAGARF